MVELVRNNEIYAIYRVGQFSILLGQIELILGQKIINFFCRRLRKVAGSSMMILARPELVSATRATLTAGLKVSCWVAVPEVEL